MLYLVATPIGNLEEITLRAIKVLKEADILYAEDTRHTAILLNHYGISKPVRSYQKFSESKKVAEIIEELKNGKTIALVSDAGMPLISDPGAILTQKLIEEGLEFTVISGACACIDAMVLSGLDASAFCMLGFLPEKISARNKLLEPYKNVPCSLVFYCPPHDVIENLEYLYDFFGKRRVAVVREISKMYEESVRGFLGELPPFTVKGEFVVVIEGARRDDALERLTIKEHYEYYISRGLDKKEAMKAVAADRGVRKSDIYKELLTTE